MIRFLTTLLAAAMLAVGAPAEAAPLQLTLPAPTGADRIGTVALHLVDRTRTDPWVPSRPVRELMVSVWYPAADVRGRSRAPWLSPGAVPHFEESLGVPPGLITLPTTHGYAGAPAKRGAHPVVLYSPGGLNDRGFGTAQVEDLVSHGYTVVTIDHTHESPEVEFPGGRVETSAIPPGSGERLRPQLIDVRAADASFVVDQLTAIAAGRNPDAERRPLPRGLRNAFDLNRIGMLGYSLGGGATATAMHDDPRIKAGFSLDGMVVGRAIEGTDRPFLLLGSEDPTTTGDPGWPPFWANQRGPKRELRLTGSVHGSFNDFQVLEPQAAALLGETPEQLAESVGTVPPARSVAIQRTYIRAFFDQTLRHRDGALLRGPSARFPEIRFIR